MARQLTFELPARVRQGPADFFVSDSNRAAYVMVTGAEGPWPDGKLALVGPPGSGKSHLVRVWQEQSGGAVVAAEDLGDDFRPGAALAVENVQRLPRRAEETLFHVHNAIRARGGRLLLTADRPPSAWPILLPDLASRMQATNVVRIVDPDDALLSALLAKLFYDRQIAAPPSLIRWLVPRIERSHAAAAGIVDRLDRAALASGERIGTGLARRLLDNGDAAA
ncbi:DnaA ATPase domain-containing protein [Wenxinia marina]|uniref:ATPase involved in DNA replication initiation n=1 Tax=Wenxinia marina DSM 24838 TaxID=1123501 RepID=A0A0D0Q8F1_9RHOB|nr:DnaA/Hda family protein [Wenxinia marina]KIQ68667.1 ATPase involved in DNA replication initiation [Wenxinia marina DSM 24838]GGL67775.1 hypothetical protein GCM10011392_22810 [Wenxinia marina]